MNNIAPKLQKCWTHKIAFKIISKMLKQPDFFYNQPSTLPKEALAKVYLTTTVGLTFMISSVALIRSSTFYAYLITKIGNRNLKYLRSTACFKTSLPKSHKLNFRHLVSCDITGWCRGISLASHARGPRFDPHQRHICPFLFSFF